MATKLLDKAEWTKDGRKWIFYDWIHNLDGTRRKYKSKKYFTKKEALETERDFMASYNTDADNNRNMTFKNLYTSYYQYQEDKVKETTLKTYRDRKRFFESLDNIKLKDFSIQHFELWRKEINQMSISTNYKNHLFKFFKALLNYGAKWYNFNFNSVYSKMINFTNPNEVQKEMEFYTYEEFKQFLSVEQDIYYKAMFEILYYCGLRRGELKGLTWEDIDFKEKTIRINKNVISYINGVKFKVTSPKTKSSNRVLPMPDILVNDLKELYEKCKSYYNFNLKWFVFGDTEPCTNNRIRDRKVRNCKLANIKEIRIHDFRHSCASLLINKGASINVVAKYLGHTKIDETLNTYTHLFKNQMTDIVNLMNELN